jgi:hypothetical protein
MIKSLGSVTTYLALYKSFLGIILDEESLDKLLQHKDDVSLAADHVYSLYASSDTGRGIFAEHVKKVSLVRFGTIVDTLAADCVGVPKITVEAVNAAKELFIVRQMCAVLLSSCPLGSDKFVTIDRASAAQAAAAASSSSRSSSSLE